MSGPRIGLLEARMSGELAALVRRHGGEPRVVPALRETPAADAARSVGELIDALTRRDVDIMVFMTGVGASALFAEAERLSRAAELVAGLQSTTNVCRGPKPRPPLKQRGVPISITVSRPYTTADVIATLGGMRLADRGVAVIHYGERNADLAAGIEAAGARLRELCLYEWKLPDDTRPLEAFVAAVVAGDLDAVAFTSQVQVRHLFQVAVWHGRVDSLRNALNQTIATAAVGPTCAAALEAEGVAPRVVPTNPKMGPMVVALMEHLTSVHRRG